ncbi:MAG: M15 family metallopeptidase [Oscillospiraceae bacterium]|nr:M15 family metallopeptidase [Oscillospiraceae bacterium]
MRRLILWLALLTLILAGCTDKKPAAAETQPTQMLLQTETAAATAPVPEPADGDFVRILDYLPDVKQELFYATDRNFTGRVIYTFEDAYLRYGTVKKLMAVSADLQELELSLKIWDGFRPVSAQFTLWEAYPDSRYVANPTRGFSSHSRGNTVDLTLVDARGQELEMPTGFDDFSDKADRDYSDCTEIQKNNALILEAIMEKHGFVGYEGEWWHFADAVSYPVEEVFDPAALG